MPTMEVWMTSPYVNSMVDFEETEDIDIDDNLIAWFDVKFSLPETEEEKKERTEAIKEQIRKGVLTEHGIPPGVEVPNDMKEKWKKSLEDKQNKLPQFNSGQRPIIKTVKGKKQVVLSPLASQIEKQLRRQRKGR